MRKIPTLMNRLAHPLVAALLVLTMAAPVAAQRITLGGSGLPRHGSTLRFDSPWYRFPEEELNVGGSVHGLPPWDTSHYVLVQGHYQELRANEHGRAGFNIWIDYDHTQVPGTPYGQWFTQPRRTLMPVVAELVDSHGLVVDRARMLLYDMRGDDETIVHYPTGDTTVGAAVQITPEGLSQLEPVHVESLPFPSQENFQQAIDDELAQRGSHLDPLPEDTCFAMPGGRGWRELDVWQSLGVRASERYAEYLLDKIALGECGGNPFCEALFEFRIATNCFHEPPLLSNFEVCTESLESELMSLSLAPPIEAPLSYGSYENRLQSEVRFGPVSAWVDGALDDLVLRWVGNSGDLCLTTPEEASRRLTTATPMWFLGAPVTTCPSTAPAPSSSGRPTSTFEPTR